MNEASFLYSFLETGERDPQELLAELARSAQKKITDSQLLIERSLTENKPVLEAAAAAIMTRIRVGGSVLTFGNGGSACDALALVRQFDGLQNTAVSARSLAADPAVLSALSNDVGAEQIFSRQIEAFGQSGDVGAAFSTSGQSANILRALGVAHQKGMLTVVFAGYRGGSMTQNADVDHCITIDSDSVHRIQETQCHLALYLCTLLNVQDTNTKEPS